MAKTQSKPNPKSKGGGLAVGNTVMLVVIGLPLVAVLAPTCSLLLVGMAPTLGAFLFDRARGRHLTLSIGMLNFCGLLPALFGLWSEGQTFRAVGIVLADPLNLLIPLGTAGMGWLIFIGITPLVASYYQVASTARLQNLKLEQQGLVEAWGEEVASEADQDAASGEAPQGGPGMPVDSPVAADLGAAVVAHD